MFLLFTPLLLFYTCVLDALQASVFTTLPHSCCFSKLVFLSFLSLCFIVLLGHVLVTFPSHILAILLDRVLLFQACNKSYCCSKFTFLLLFSIMFSLFQIRVIVAPTLQQEFLLFQAHILIFVGHVLDVPRSCSCCYYQSCFYYSKLTFKCCYS